MFNCTCSHYSKGIGRFIINVKVLNNRKKPLSLIKSICLPKCKFSTETDVKKMLPLKYVELTFTNTV